MATVITVPGLLNDYDATNYQGTLFSSPNVYEDGQPDWLNGALNINDSSATSDMNHLDDLIHIHIDDSPGQRLIVAGHSRGAQVIYKWLRQIGPTSDIDPADILFISAANPERKYNGASVVHNAGHAPVYPGTGGYGVGYGLPNTPTAYLVLDIARQYDQWCDHADEATDSSAARDVTVTADVHSAYADAPELGLDGYPTNWDDWTYWVEGNVTYLVAPYFPFPDTPAQAAYPLQAQICKRLEANHDKDYGRIDAATRQSIELAFRRKKPIQPPRRWREGA